MLGKVAKKLFGSRNDRIVKQYGKVVTEINAFEEQISALSDDELKAQTDKLKARLQQGETLQAILPEAFATVREVGKRVFNMRHFDVQMIGGMVLNDGKIAEMRTGEGKTLVATLPAYLNALSGESVHVITVNDYLARRDADWMGKIYNFLGLSVGVVVSEQGPDEKREAYAADITYGTNNEYGFDYLRDNMAFAMEDKFQRGHAFAVIDEVDSILVDEARTPLIISGPADDSSDLYQKINAMVPQLDKAEKAATKDEPDGPGDYTVEEKHKQIYLTEDGHQKVEDMLAEAGLLGEGESLYNVANIGLMHHMHAAIRAHVLFLNNVDYIVQNGEVVIVDEFTGRTMPGRRWSDGLHQAIEAKEGVTIQNENQTVASITFQNYFRMYKKLSGMTGTADTEAYEFQTIYGLEVVVIPTHRDMVRDDQVDQIFLTQTEKFNAIAEDIRDCQQKGQPVLVGTTSIEVSEYLSGLLKKQKVKHEVLNAKQHAREADIVAQAGSLGAVTIATNMAGRGTDIVLGGNLEVELQAANDARLEKLEKIKQDWAQRHEQVLKVGGLRIIGTERHESRRVDNQLRGRAGRQGDPGSSRFYLSLEDSLMRIFASERVSGIMQKLGMQENEAIEHPWVSKAIENAQRKVEGFNFDTRKSLLEYDDVANDQRKVIYAQRDDIMASEDLSELVKDLRFDVVNALIDGYIPPQSMEEQWDVPGLQEAIEGDFNTKLEIEAWLKQDDNLHEAGLREKILGEIEATYQHKEEDVGSEVVRHVEKAVLLQVLDNQWREHLALMDQLRRGIGLRAHAQKNPKQEYKRESFQLFTELLEHIKHEAVTLLSRVQIQSEADVEALEAQRRKAGEIDMEFQHDEASAMAGEEGEQEEEHKPFVREGRKIGRNEPCPCGSGKKYKQCHGKLV